MRISICDESMPADDVSTVQCKQSESRKALGRKKLRLDLSGKFASLLGPYSFTDLRSIHEDTIRRSALSSASGTSSRCLCNLPPTFCPRPHSPVRKTANFFSSSENLPQCDPPELTAYSHTAVDPTVGLSLSNRLQGKRNSLPLPDSSLQHEYKELEFYDQFQERLRQKIGYDKLERPESRPVSKPEIKPKPVMTKRISKSGSTSQLRTMGYNVLSRGAEPIIHKSPTMEIYYGNSDGDKCSLLKSSDQSPVKPKPVVAKKPANGGKRMTSAVR